MGYMSKEQDDKLATKKITKREVDYSAWYTDVIDAAKLAEHSPVKGCMIIRPNGYAIWENVQKIIDAKNALGMTDKEMTENTNIDTITIKYES